MSNKIDRQESGNDIDDPQKHFCPATARALSRRWRFGVAPTKHLVSSLAARDRQSFIEAMALRRRAHESAIRARPKRLWRTRPICDRTRIENPGAGVGTYDAEVGSAHATKTERATNL